ncbi:hypothetical protein AM588_10007412 [Phytophthora nicotianae]|uniref:ADP-ribosylation factor-like protein 2-binding protein n=1 Tax=Phytophthora nicotianae TaxID=4792 RepID=A0A0W8CLR3_PHYNI|nr:hypothetical protein AM588_10007412 [Phytophthora nicotianae]
MTDFEGLDEEEEIFDNDVGEENAEESKFDEMIGVLQDILMDPNLSACSASSAATIAVGYPCKVFDNVSENKLIYMDIFQQYTNLIDEIPPDITDVLLSSSDFEEFKNLMLSFKQNENPCIEITGGAILRCNH